MKQWIAVGGIVAAVVGVSIWGTLTLSPKNDLDLCKWGQLPVMAGGRVMPLDAAARQSALFITGKQYIATDGQRMSAIQWMALSIEKPQVADSLPLFTVTHDELRSFLGITDTMGKRVSFSFLASRWGVISQQAFTASDLPEDQRNAFQRNLLQVRDQMWRYIQLKNSFYAESVADISTDYAFFMKLIDNNRDKFRALDSAEFNGEDPEVMSLMMYIQKYQSMGQISYLWIVKDPKMTDSRAWMSMGQGILFDTMRRGSIGVARYVDTTDALRKHDTKRFNTGVSALLADAHAHPAGYSPFRLKAEYTFLQVQPYMSAMVIYLAVCALVVAGWWLWPLMLHRSAAILLSIGFGIHTLGMLASMLIHGRPPVTNLYSSAVYVGWIAVLGGLWMNRKLGRGVGYLIGGAIGFTTLIIAHQLSISGDTLGVMQAVLDSNFWLATHVVTITTGYSASFLAGVLGIFALMWALFAPKSDNALIKKLSDATYFMVALTVVLSFIGTVLGGIWADQSWGRFWGWDPKENGALLIVLWSLIVLHARKAGIVGRFGVATLAVLGNIVTAFSWFGVNMLGIGLHAYGFMEKGVVWLCVFGAVNLAIVGVALIKRRKIIESGLS